MEHPNQPGTGVRAACESQVIPTYPPKAPNDLPMFFEKKPYQGATGRLYPLAYSDGITDEKKDVEYQVYTLENEYLLTQVLPALGGKVLRGYDKAGEYDFIYHNRVVKPALVGLAGAWISGGIEFNWPQHHRPTTFLPLEAALEENPDGSKTVWTGEVDPFCRMKGMAGITVEPHRSYIKAKVRIYNRTSLPQLFMWWANLAVPVNKDYRTIFPPDVEWVNDHDRRAVLPWPVAKGIYHTARPFDYGSGTDISQYEAVKVPSSFLVSQGQSEMDFVAGYDSGLGKGIVTVADHQIAPGKKMWTWGHGEFGEMWCNNLTDEDGPYIELMTGVYTDNQPDFTWLAPYETREFEQVWYPVRGIGDVKNATVDAAMNLEQRPDGLFVGFMVTGPFPGCRIRVAEGEKVLFEETADLDPAAPWCRTLPLAGCRFEGLTASLEWGGRALVEYSPRPRGEKQPIPVRQPVRRPAEYATVEELYLNGFHLEQYKQHNYDPRDYYAEGLRRDPGDARCNTSMGRLALRDGRFEEAVGYFDAAIARLTCRNQHPTDTQALYLKGVALCYLGRYKEAYDALSRAGWDYSTRAAAHYQLAALDCRAHRWAAALEKLQLSQGLSAGHTRAADLRCAVLRHTGRKGEATALARAGAAGDLLDLWARFELLLLTGEGEAELKATFGGKPENYLDLVCDYLEAGFAEDALAVIELAGGSYPLLLYYKAHCLQLLGRDPGGALAAAAAADTGLCFPARLEDIAVLRWAAGANPADANAPYYLGCLFYDRFRYEEAIAQWEAAVARDPGHAKALRCLALGYFDRRGDAASAAACMQRALAHKQDPRLLFEYQQLLKNTDTPPAARLALYEQLPALCDARDDCVLDKIVLLCLLRRYPEAIALAKGRHFHIYEGGEGNLTRQHGWMHLLQANALAAAGKEAEAEAAYREAAVLPKSYGEAKTYFNQEAHIYYYLGRLLAGRGDAAAARQAFEEAAVYKATVSELSLFRALALRELGRYSEAFAVLQEMLAAGQQKLDNKDLRGYYGVGSPCPMPFEYDIEKQNLTAGHLLRGYALLGLGRRGEAGREIAAAAALDPYNFSVFAYGEIAPTLG